jgi:hypothetical protein
MHAALLLGIHRLAIFPRFRISGTFGGLEAQLADRFTHCRKRPLGWVQNDDIVGPPLDASFHRICIQLNWILAVPWLDPGQPHAAMRDLRVIVALAFPAGLETGD